MVGLQFSSLSICVYVLCIFYNNFLWLSVTLYAVYCVKPSQNQSKAQKELVPLKSQHNDKILQRLQAKKNKSKMNGYLL